MTPAATAQRQYWADRPSGFLAARRSKQRSLAMRRPPLARLLALVAVATAGVSLAACSNPSSQPVTATSNSPVKATTTTALPQTTTTTAPAATSTSVTTTTVPAPSPCLGSVLAVTKNNFNGAAGQLSVGFGIGNKGSVSCTIFGYPALVLKGGGAPVPVTSHSAQGPAFRPPPRLSRSRRAGRPASSTNSPTCSRTAGSASPPAPSR